jgi:hypothetical protein
MLQFKKETLIYNKNELLYTTALLAEGIMAVL